MAFERSFCYSLFVPSCPFGCKVPARPLAHVRFSNLLHREQKSYDNSARYNAHWRSYICMKQHKTLKSQDERSKSQSIRTHRAQSYPLIPWRLCERSAHCILNYNSYRFMAIDSTHHTVYWQIICAIQNHTGSSITYDNPFPYLILCLDSTLLRCISYVRLGVR